MKVGPRALYIELKRRYNGNNNGSIHLSHREAAEALSAHRNSMGRWFNELEKRGFIVMTKAPYLGSEGIGRSTEWALSELPTKDGKKAKMGFKEWKSPATKNYPPPHKNCAYCVTKIVHAACQLWAVCTTNVTLSAILTAISCTKTVTLIYIAMGNKVGEALNRPRNQSSQLQHFSTTQRVATLTFINMQSVCERPTRRPYRKSIHCNLSISTQR